MQRQVGINLVAPKNRQDGLELLDELERRLFIYNLMNTFKSNIYIYKYKVWSTESGMVKFTNELQP